MVVATLQINTGVVEIEFLNSDDDDDDDDDGDDNGDDDGNDDDDDVDADDDHTSPCSCSP